jgi:hypothetical protein
VSGKGGVSGAKKKKRCLVASGGVSGVIKKDTHMERERDTKHYQKEHTHQERKQKEVARVASEVKHAVMQWAHLLGFFFLCFFLSCW